MPSVLNRARQPVLPPLAPAWCRAELGWQSLSDPAWERGEAGRGWEAFAGPLLLVVSPVPQNGVRWRSIPCPALCFGSSRLSAPCHRRQLDPMGCSLTAAASGSLPAPTAHIAFSLQFGVQKKKCSPAWKCPLCLAPVSPSGQSPVPPPGLAPASGRGAGGQVAGSPPGSPGPDQSAQRAVL